MFPEIRKLIFLRFLMKKQLQDTTVEPFKVETNNKWSRYLKRLIDIFGACIGLVVFSLLFLILPILIRAGSEGPAFHKRKVVGIKRFSC